MKVCKCVGQEMLYKLNYLTYKQNYVSHSYLLEPVYKLYQHNIKLHVQCYTLI